MAKKLETRKAKLEKALPINRSTMPIELTGNDLTVEQLRRVVYEREAVALAASARKGVESARAAVEKLIAQDRVVSGAPPGFGARARVKTPPDQLKAVQLTLLRSHAAGVGEPLSEPETRATLLLRANVLAKGYSGGAAPPRGAHTGRA